MPWEHRTVLLCALTVCITSLVVGKWPAHEGGFFFFCITFSKHMCLSETEKKGNELRYEPVLNFQYTMILWLLNTAWALEHSTELKCPNKSTHHKSGMILKCMKGRLLSVSCTISALSALCAFTERKSWIQMLMLHHINVLKSPALKK